MKRLMGLKKNQQVLLHGLCKVDLIVFFFFHNLDIVYAREILLVPFVAGVIWKVVKS